MTRAPWTQPGLDALFARIAAHDPRLHAFIDPDPAGAARAIGATGPLQGLSVGVKGNIPVRGLANTGGSAARRGRIAGADNSVVARLRASGAAIAGTLNLHEGALGATTRNEAFGWAANPWAEDRTPGGSSGGSGVAVAAGLVDVALGSDTLGSIRIPAAYCGLFGYAPAGNWLAQDGVIPLQTRFDRIGPLTRDAATLLEVVAALDGPAPQAPSGHRFGVLRGWQSCESGVESAFEATLAQLRDAGVALVDVQLPPGPTAQDAVLAGFVLCAHEAGSVHWASEMADPESGISRQFRFLMDYGLKADARRLADCEAITAQVGQNVQQLMIDHELSGVVSPTAPEVAFPHTAEPPLQAGFTCLANLAGLSGLSIPVGLSAGLPVGLMVTAAPGADGAALWLARLFPGLVLPPDPTAAGA